MQKTKGRRIILPPVVRELQKPFFSKKIDPDLESLMRFNGIVQRYAEGPPIARQYLSGGAGTEMGLPVSEEYAAEFEALSRLLYLQPRTESKEKTAFAQEQLRTFLKERNIELSGGFRARDFKLPNLHHTTYELILEVLSLLPDSHLTSEHFSKLSLGGWGSGAAKCSQYIDQEVHIYQFPLRGARRNLVAILLHEVGHSFFAGLSREQIIVLHNFRKMMATKARSDIFGVQKPELVLAADYLYGAESRITYSLGTTNEFVPESYMHYVTQGAFTAEGLAERRDIAKSENDTSEPSHFDSFVRSVPPKLANAYNALWRFLRQQFEEVEYV